MDELEGLAAQFQANRGRLRSVAYRMLGSVAEAEDAVQEAWFRLSRTDTSVVENLGGWLTTVVGRISLDMLRARETRGEKPMSSDAPTSAVVPTAYAGSDEETLLADSVGLALLVVLEKLTPAERIAFVLHDLFDLSFEEISPIVDRSPVATRQLASRARRRVRGGSEIEAADLSRQRRVVDAFLAASRGGDLQALLAVLDPNVVFRADQAAVRAGGKSEVDGAAAVANAFLGKAQAARFALVNGVVGAVVAPNGHLLLVLTLGIRDGKIMEIQAFADRGFLARADIAVPGDWPST
jgi:RNA polymerase sigma-70 factor, ECF subfamily